MARPIASRKSEASGTFLNESLTGRLVEAVTVSASAPSWAMVPITSAAERPTGASEIWRKAERRCVRSSRRERRQIDATDDERVGAEPLGEARGKRRRVIEQRDRSATLRRRLSDSASQRAQAARDDNRFALHQAAFSTGALPAWSSLRASARAFVASTALASFTCPYPRIVS